MITAVDTRISFPAMAALIASLRHIGVTERDHRLRVLSAIVKRPLKTTRDIQRTELGLVQSAIEAKRKELIQ